MLYESGRWDEALAWVSDPQALSDLGFVQVMLAEVHVARGNLEAAEELLRRSAALSERDQPQFAGRYDTCRIRMLLQTGRATEAAEVALSIAGTVQASSDLDAEGWLLLAGAEAAAAARSPDRVEDLVSCLRDAGKGRIGAAVLATIDGERSRAAGAPEPEAWLNAAREWAVVGRPYEEARARLRAAEAVLVSRSGASARRTAAAQLIAARRLAEQLSAAPLLQEIGKLARLARVDTGRVDEVVQDSEPSVLTEREQQVLALLADGLTNKEIGDALYMSPKTASVHVTHILEKLGVQSRVQAAAEAVRLGLDEPLRSRSVEPHSRKAGAFEAHGRRLGSSR